MAHTDYIRTMVTSNIGDYNDFLAEVKALRELHVLPQRSRLVSWNRVAKELGMPLNTVHDYMKGRMSVRHKVDIMNAILVSAYQQVIDAQTRIDDLVLLSPQLRSAMPSDI